MNPIIGFIGFGEAGSAIARGLNAAGAGQIRAFDINTHNPKLGPGIQSRARETETLLVESRAELAGTSDILFSTVTAHASLDAAREFRPFLERPRLYADLNSVSPKRKQEIAEVVGGTATRFVEVAVMAPVLPYGHCVPMLLGGAGAYEFAELMKPYGMRLEVISDGVGAAAATKMFRSIVVKGLEALVLECVLAASRYDADERVFASLVESFPGINWKKLADYMVGRVVVHGERRAHEMEEVAETLRSLGIDPIMAEATARRQAWCAGLGLRSQFGNKGPETYRQVLEAIE
jgi:3-hydroxyisobutyrate dehydrogenase-like beta-hydroxyacid dehydrogenase